MKKHRLGVDLFLILIIVSLYVATVGRESSQTVSALVYDGPIYRGSSEDTVALQFELSWDAAAVDAILDTLEDRQVSASFAVSGEYALLRPDTVARICNDGHELITMGNKPSFDGNADEVKADITDSLNSIYNACGTAPSMYYSGRRDTAVSQKAASQMGLTHVQCTVDLRCASGNADDITERGLNKPIIGSIILMQPTGEAAKALDGLILGFEMKGITVGTVSDVLAQDW